MKTKNIDTNSLFKVSKTINTQIKVYDNKEKKYKSLPKAVKEDFIFTDGSLTPIHEERNTRRNKPNEIIIENFYNLSDATFLIVFKTEERFMHKPVTGMFNIITDTKVYLKDSKDITALAVIKDVIETFKSYNSGEVNTIEDMLYLYPNTTFFLKRTEEENVFKISHQHKNIKTI